MAEIRDSRKPKPPLTVEAQAFNIQKYHMSNRLNTPTNSDDNEKIQQFMFKYNESVSAVQKIGDQIIKMVEQIGEERAFFSIQKQDPTVSRGFLKTMLKVGQRDLKPDSKEAMQAMADKIQASGGN